jgi:hypothetical protein
MEGGGNPDGGDDRGGDGDGAGSRNQMAGASLVKPSMLSQVDSVSAIQVISLFPKQTYGGDGDIAE